MEGPSTESNVSKSTLVDDNHSESHEKDAGGIKTEPYEYKIPKYENNSDIQLSNSNKNEDVDNDAIYKCTQCSYIGNTRRKLTRHLTNHNMPTLQCSKCPYQAKGRVYLKKHHLLKHSDVKTTFICYHCTYTTHWKMNLVNHFTFHHAENVEIFKCPEPGCTFQTKNKFTLRTHSKVHSEEARTYNCDFCDYKAKVHGTLKMHLENKHDISEGTYKCRFCSFEIDKKSKLVYHVQTKHDLGKYPCEQCSFVAKSSLLLRRHQTYHNKTKLQCPQCSYQVNGEENLKKHLLSKHEELKPKYMCHICTFTTYWKPYLKKHIKLNHTENIEIFKCPETGCTYQTKIKSQMNFHSKYHSENVRIYTCDFCTYATKWKSSLGTHIQNRHDISTVTYKCKFCQFECKSRARFWYHTKTKHDGGIYKCFKCAFVGNSKLVLRKHQRIHNVEDQQCPYCPLKTKFKENLKKHVLLKHKEVEPAFQCRKCAFTSHWKDSLDTHMRTQHVNEVSKCLEPKIQNEYAMETLSGENQNISKSIIADDKRLETCEMQVKYLIENDSKENEDFSKSGVLDNEGLESIASNAEDIKTEINDFSKPKHKSSDESDYSKPKGKSNNEIDPDKTDVDNPIYKCNQCSYVGSCELFLNVHLRRHSMQMIQCPHCPYQVKDKGNYKKHLVMKHDKVKPIFQCYECSYTTHWKPYLKTHIKTNHNKHIENFKCPEEGCTYQTPNKFTFQNHRKVHSENSRIFKCDFCNYMAKDMKTLKTHLEDVHDLNDGTYKCEICDFESKSKSRFLYHRRTKHDSGDHQCSQCSFVGTCKFALRRHEKSHSKKMLPGDPKYMMAKHSKENYDTSKSGILNDECLKNLENGAQDTNTEITKSKRECNDEISPNKIEHEANGPIYKCTLCPYVGSCELYLTVHMKRHKMRMIQCPHCPYQVKDRGNFKKHLIIKHDEIKPIFQCFNCSYSTHWKPYLRTHIKLHHNEHVEKFKCPKCTYETTNKVSFKNHRKVHSEDTRIFNCDSCSYSAKDIHTLKNHLADVHNINNETYTCQFCDYESKSKSRFSYHRRTKHDSGDYPCSQCSFVGTCKFALRRHEKSHSKKKLPETSNAKPKDNNPTRSLECAYCLYQAKGKLDLKTHLKLHHIKIKPAFKCHECCYISYVKADLTKHLELHRMDDAGIFKCQEEGCSYRAVNQITMKKHSKVHSKETQIYKCDLCIFVTKHSAALQSHLKYMHDVTSENYKCELCNFFTRYSAALKKHMNYMHCVNRGTHKCKFCSYETKNYSEFSYHVKTDHGKDWHGCPECPFIGMSKSGLARHVARQHNRNMLQSELKSKNNKSSENLPALKNVERVSRKNNESQIDIEENSLWLQLQHELVSKDYLSHAAVKDKAIPTNPLNKERREEIKIEIEESEFSPEIKNEAIQEDSSSTRVKEEEEDNEFSGSEMQAIEDTVLENIKVEAENDLVLPVPTDNASRDEENTNFEFENQVKIGEFEFVKVEDKSMTPEENFNADPKVQQFLHSVEKKSSPSRAEKLPNRSASKTKIFSVKILSVKKIQDQSAKQPLLQKGKQNDLLASKKPFSQEIVKSSFQNANESSLLTGIASAPDKVNFPQMLRVRLSNVLKRAALKTDANALKKNTAEHTNAAINILKEMKNMSKHTNQTILKKKFTRQTNVNLEGRSLLTLVSKNYPATTTETEVVESEDTLPVSVEVTQSLPANSFGSEAAVKEEEIKTEETNSDNEEMLFNMNEDLDIYNKTTLEN